MKQRKSGGERGIRTLETVSRLRDFQRKGHPRNAKAFSETASERGGTGTRERNKRVDRDVSEPRWAHPGHTPRGFTKIAAACVLALLSGAVLVAVPMSIFTMTVLEYRSTAQRALTLAERVGGSLQVCNAELKSARAELDERDRNSSATARREP